MPLSENEGIEKRRFVVTGGAGFLGRALCLELVRRGAAEVRSLDRNASPEALSPLRKHGVVCITGDVRRKEDVEKAFKHANCVFHLASFGMSGKEMLQARNVDEVNLDGTCHVLESCVTCGVERLVYTSTFNVVFGGQEITNGHESMEYFPADSHVDPYGRSKTLAEQLVLRNNNRPIKFSLPEMVTKVKLNAFPGRKLRRFLTGGSDLGQYPGHRNPVYRTLALGKYSPVIHALRKGEGRKLYTCALRPGAIYGPGETRHLPRILNMAEAGLLLFRVGSLDTKQDWVYIDNLVQAQLLASMSLLDDIPEKGAKANGAGQVYFISDGAPVNTAEFLRPLVEALGHKFPDRELSVRAAMRLAWFFWGLYIFAYPILERSWLPQPLILPAEVHKVGVTHYFSLLKARKELGYLPTISPREGMSRTISYFKAKQEGSVPRPSFFIFALTLQGLFSHFVIAFVPRDYQGPFVLLSNLLVSSVFVWRVTWVLAVAVHFLEASYAWWLARKVDPSNAGGWFRQTLAVGYFSIRLLQKRRKSRTSDKQA